MTPATLAALPDEFLLTLNSLEILGIIYLAIALSSLRASVARLEGRLEGTKRIEPDEERRK